MVDALGNPLAFLLTPGQAHHLEGADAVLPQMQADTLLADKAFDADKRVIEPLLQVGKTPVIPSMPGRKQPRPYDRDLFVARHLHRELLLEAEAVPRHRHAIRQERDELPALTDYSGAAKSSIGSGRQALSGSGFPFGQG